MDLYPSIRFTLGFIILAGNIAEDTGQSVLDFINKDFPRNPLILSPKEVYNRIKNIALKASNTKDDDMIRDALQDFLVYLSEKNIKYSAKVNTGAAGLNSFLWDFADRCKSAKTELNIKKKQFDLKDSGNEQNVDNDFDLEDLNPSLDNQVAVKEFMNLLDDHLVDLQSTLSDDEKALFDVIFNDEVGSFTTNINENMNQSTSLKKKYPELFEKNQKRWSGFVGDLRKKLLNSIWKYIDHHMTQQEYNTMKDTFFSDTDSSSFQKPEKSEYV